MKTPGTPVTRRSPLRPLPNLIFASRWLQLPLYLGLIVAQAVYVVHFLLELLAPGRGGRRQQGRAAAAGHQHRLQDRAPVGS
jgi:hypothetical protein